MSIKKNNIILDLDNTLINSLSFNEIKNLSQEKIKKFKYIDMDNIYRIFLRPHLQEFLDYLFKNFNVSIWTAASLSYASFIIENIILIKPDRKLDYVFFSYHCSYSKRFFKCIKDIRLLWNNFKLFNYKPDNTYIIDDLNDIYKTIPEHTIRAKYFDIFEINSENDTFLVDVIKKLNKIK